MSFELLYSLIIASFVHNLAAQVLYNTSAYTLGPNLISDEQFLDPPLAANSTHQNFLGHMSTWNCQNTCQQINPYYVCIDQKVACNLSSSIRGVDLDSLYVFDNVSQSINIPSAGSYILYIKWIPAIYTAIGKSFQIQIGNVIAMNVTTTANTSFIQSYTAQSTVNLSAGSQIFNMRMYAAVSNSYGPMIHYVCLQQLIPIILPVVVPTTPQKATNSSHTSITPTNITPTKTTPTNTTPAIKPQSKEVDDIFKFFLDKIFLNDANLIINKIPGNRVILNYLTCYFNLFDRFYLYYYHHQNNTYYSQVFLKENAEFTQNKSSLSFLLVQMCLPSSQICLSINNTYNNLLNQLSQKYNYTDSDFLAKNNNGIGFFANHLDFLYFELPFMLLNLFVFYQLFALLFRYRVSIFFRKYSLFAIILFVAFEGNVEQFAFDIFCELKCFFSANFTHKMANAVILLILFVMLVFAVASLLWLKYHYKKLVKYFAEYSGLTVNVLIYESYERNIFPLILGGVHAFGIQHLGLQTIVLTALQVFYLILKLGSMRKAFVKEKMIAAFTFLASGIKILLILTFYLYQYSGVQIISSIHRDLIIFYIVNWGLQISPSLIQCLKYLCFVFKKKQRAVLSKSNQKYVITKKIKANSEQKPKPTHKKRISKAFMIYLITEENQKINILDRNTIKYSQKQKADKKRLNIKSSKQTNLKTLAIRFRQTENYQNLIRKPTRLKKQPCLR